MIDKTHSPRQIPYSVERIETLLEAALEHASHGWHAFEQEKPIKILDRDSWPPPVEAEVGSSEYHLAEVIIYLYEAWSSITKEAEHNREVEEAIERARNNSGS